MGDNDFGLAAGRLMGPVVVFFGIAAVVGCALLGVVRWRLAATARQVDASDDQLCQLQQASRITSVGVVVSLTALALVGLAAFLL